MYDGYLSLEKMSPEKHWNDVFEELERKKRLIMSFVLSKNKL